MTDLMKHFWEIERGAAVVIFILGFLCGIIFKHRYDKIILEEFKKEIEGI